MENCCFIGHRFLKKGQRRGVKRKLRATIEGLIQQGVTSFICGGNRGFATIAGLIVWDLKERHSDVRLIMLLPYHDYRAVGYEISFAKLLAAADEVVYTAKEYYFGCRQHRNMRMLESCTYLVAYVLGDRRGMLNVADELGLKVINLAHVSQ